MKRKFIGQVKLRDRNINPRVIIAAIALAVTFLAPARAFCWEETTHNMLSGLVVKYLPERYRKTAKLYEDSYMLGVGDAGELFPGGEGAKEYDAERFGTAGMQLLMDAVRKMSALRGKNAPGGQVAYQMGRLNRLLEDYLEPLPGPGAKFTALETAGTRIFFTADAAERYNKFDFLFDGYDESGALVKDVETVLEKNRKEGELVYAAYRRGDGFDAAVEPVEKSLNRALNLIVDVYYTLERAERYKPVDIEQFLGLKKFRGSGKTKTMDIEQPGKPAPPKPPATPEPEEEKGKSGSGG